MGHAVSTRAMTMTLTVFWEKENVELNRASAIRVEPHTLRRT